MDDDPDVQTMRRAWRGTGRTPAMRRSVNPRGLSGAFDDACGLPAPPLAFFDGPPHPAEPGNIRKGENMSKAREQMQEIIQNANHGVCRTDSKANPQTLSEAAECNPKDAPSHTESIRMREADRRR